VVLDASESVHSTKTNDMERKCSLTIFTQFGEFACPCQSSKRAIQADKIQV